MTEAPATRSDLHALLATQRRHLALLLSVMMAAFVLAGLLLTT